MRSAKHMSSATSAILHNVYVGPSLEYLRAEIPSAYLLGELRISSVEIKTGMSNEGEFIALLSARLHSTLSEMAAIMRAPTFPVHDEPMPEPR
jgi:hypothetical protein